MSGMWDHEEAGTFVETLFAKHHGEIYAYLLRMMRDPEVAADMTQDAFINVAGGAKVTEPSADLGVVIAAASSYLDRPVRGDVVVIGEVGLTGEVRAVAGLPARLREAAALGFASAIVPQNNLATREAQPLEVQGVGSVEEAVKALLGG